MKTKVKTSGLVFAVLKAGQQILNDLDPIVMNNTKADLARYMTEQYICKIGSTAVLSYTVDKTVDYLEEIILPKCLRGILPITAATIGAGAAIHYGAEYMNMQPGTGVLETTKQLLINYKDNLDKLISLDPNINESYLIGALVTVKSGLRWMKNIAESIAKHSNKKRIKEKLNEETEENLEKISKKK